MDTRIDYLLHTLSNALNLPIRHYENGELTKLLFDKSLAIDPLDLYIDKIKNLTAPVTFYFTSANFYYAVINLDNNKLIIGPISELPPSEEEVFNLITSLPLEGEQSKELDGIIKNLPSHKTSELANTISLFMYAATGNEYHDKDVVIDTSLIANNGAFDGNIDGDLTNFEKENIMLNLISTGQEDKLKSSFTSFNNLLKMNLSQNNLQHAKYVFVLAATLVSRAAIRGGVLSDEAITLANQYIQHADLLSDELSINTLQYQMIFNFVHKVNLLKNSNSVSRLVIDAKNYIALHIDEDLKVEKIADYFKINRSYLSTRFKVETNQTLIDYILTEKINKAKELLRYSDRSLLSISKYLRFSSQSHFQNTFKKYVGMTPKQYRSTPYIEENNN